MIAEGDAILNQMHPGLPKNIEDGALCNDN